MQRLARLVVGLGNPGPDYEGTRHNVGFAVLDRLARTRGLLFEGPRSLEDYHGPRDLWCARWADPAALLVKPSTYMNLSGDVVGPLVSWAGIPADGLLVVYDDLDLPPAALRLRPFGGAGGHNGMRSIIDTLGTDRFPRLRVGIGRSTTDAARHVLSRFSRKEQGEVDVSVAEAADAVLFWLETGDIEACMTRFQSRWNQDQPGTKGP